MKMSWKPQPAEEGAEEKGDGKKPFVNIEEYDDEPTEEEGQDDKPREMVLWQSIYVALTLTLVVAALGSGWRKVAIEIIRDPNWIRLAFIAVFLPQFVLALVCIPMLCTIGQQTNECSSSSKLWLLTLPN